MTDYKHIEINWYLILSYFDEIRGPKIFHSNNVLKSIEQPDLEKILDVLDYNIGGETYTFAFRKHQIINYLFYIDNKFARGRQDLLMISYVIEPEYFRKKNIDIFKYLESKKEILEEYAEELKKLNEFPGILHNRNNQYSKRFEKTFLELFNKYSEILTPNFINEFEKWTPIQLQCPVCKEQKLIEIPERIINQENNLTNISIPKYKICEHAFMVSVDKKFKVHDSEYVDFDLNTLGLPNKLKPYDIDVFRIKSNLRPEMLIDTLHACFLKKKVLLLSKKLKSLNKIITDFFIYLFQDSFKIDISIKNKREYKKNKKKYDGNIILKKNLLRTSRDISNNKLKFEKEMVNKFYKNEDSIASIINLRDKIQEIYNLSHKLSMCKGKTSYLHRKEAIRYLEDTHFLRIKKDYFYFLVNITREYFDIDIKLTQDVLAKKIEEMWGN